MNITVADKIAGSLRRHGITFILGQSNPTSLMLAAEKIGIRQVFYRTENAGGIMADGYSRVSNQITAVAAQNGPAATLLVAPMAEAMKASIPMLILVQEVPALQRDRNAFQELDHFALFEGVSKWTRCIDDPSRAEDYVDMAITVANSGRPGPTVLLLPKDILNLDAVPSKFPRTQNLGAFPLDCPRPAVSNIQHAAELLANAIAPVVIAGGGVHIAKATQELKELQSVAKLPVATTNMGKGAVDETGALSLGVAANITGKNGPASFYRSIITDADVVLFIGSRTNENGTDAWTLTSPDATYIHIDVDSLEIGRNYEAVRIVGDAKPAIADLTVALGAMDLSRRYAAHEKLTEQISKGRAMRAAVIESFKDSNSVPILPEKLLADLDSLLKPDDIVVADASYASIWVTSYLTARKAGQRFLSPRGLAGLGWGLPLGMGAKLAAPTSRVVAIVGDGGFAHVWSELETAVRESIVVVVIVLNNSILGYQKHAENYFFRQTTTAIEFMNIDHGAVARSAGAAGVLVDKPADILPALRSALESNQTTVIDVIVDPDAYAPVKFWDGMTDKING